MTDAPLIRRSPVSMRRCNLAKSFELIGDRWSLLILRSALYGLRRFDDFQADIDIPRSVLSARLAGLVESGILEGHEYREDGQRPRTEYWLTEMGRQLTLPFMAMTAWGDRWLGEGISPLTLHSKTSGERISVAFVDEKGRAVKPSGIEMVIDGNATKAPKKK